LGSFAIKGDNTKERSIQAGRISKLHRAKLSNGNGGVSGVGRDEHARLCSMFPPTNRVHRHCLRQSLSLPRYANRRRGAGIRKL